MVRKLRRGRHGVAVSGWVPREWRPLVWSGLGRPIQALVEDILSRLQNSLPLPSVAALAADRDLEASCARALDLQDEDRIPVLLSADDPCFLASSRGAMLDVVQVIQDWAKDYKASLHTGPSKTVMQASGPEASLAVLHTAIAAYLQQGLHALPSAIEWALSHRWLGLNWRHDGDLEAHMNTILATCHVLVNYLCFALHQQAIPLAIVRLLFIIKVESKLRFARWLWACNETALQALNSVYEDWARRLMGADPWRNWAMCFSELGWDLTGSARAIYDIAMMRAHFWLSGSTLAGEVCQQAHTSEANQWARKSYLLLQEWQILDWPAWSRTREGHALYKTYVANSLRAKCLPIWHAEASNHISPIPCTSISEKPHMAAHDSLRAALPWEILTGHLALCRLRCGLLALGHLRNVRTTAKVQQCILCDKRYTDVFRHVVSCCDELRAPRATLHAASVNTQDLSFLTVCPKDENYSLVVQFAAYICKNESMFWQK